VRFVLLLAFALSGCTSQFAFGPAAWTTAPPVIPGYHPLALPGGGFIEQPDTPPAPAATPEQSVLGALQEAQATREAIRKLAR
jgi:hypothetical protein